jgi:hypothetical protein
MINIDTTKPEDLVKFTHPEAGYDCDQEQAAKHLTKGRTYTINFLQIYDWNTAVHLVEFPGEVFNSVMFDNVEVKPK